MLFVHPIPSERWLGDDDYAAIVETAETAIVDIRTYLPALGDDLYLLVHQTTSVIDATAEGGYTVGPQCIRWDVDPRRGIAEVARVHLRHTLFHECHHAVRLQRRPEDAHLVDWLSIAAFEGLACVFESTAGGYDPSHRRYDPSTIEDWCAELLARPVGPDWADWKFQHPDGRSLIAYRVGSWIAERAIAASGQAAHDLVWAAPQALARMAGLTVTPTT